MKKEQNKTISEEFSELTRKLSDFLNKYYGEYYFIVIDEKSAKICENIEQKQTLKEEK